MKVEAPQTYYYQYQALHRAHKEAPDTWHMQRCTKILTEIMAHRSWSWHVVAITRATLRLLAANDFKRTQQMGIKRGHRVERIETTRRLMEPSEPLGETEFWREWLENDKTILCGPGENRRTIPPSSYIEIENEDCGLFPSKGFTFRLGDAERKYLRKLYERMMADENGISGAS